jgi:plastocyanin
MFKPIRLAVIASSLVLVVAGCSQKAAEHMAATRPSGDVVTIDNFTFDPPTLTVSRGAKVTWLNRDDVPHTATSSASPRAFDSKALDTDEQFSFVFTTPGSYPYFCAVHPHMTATIVVK